jgi:hypothetical protein
LAFGAVPWKAVLAGMSDETLNTLEPFAMKLTTFPVQQGAGQAPTSFIC